MPIPNFILIGAPKCGTSSLYQYLKQHPDVFMTVPKEPYFFVPAREKETWLNLGLKPVMTEVEYAKLFEGRAHEKIVGEASAPYLYTSETPVLIRKSVPDVKLVAVLRNPIDRAYSQFHFLKRLGLEKMQNFSQAIAEEERRERNGVAQFLLYKKRGLYGEQLARYYEVFDRSQMRVYLYEQLDKDGLSVIKDILEFLEIDPRFKPDMSERHNRTLVEDPGIAGNMAGMVAGVTRKLSTEFLKGESRNDLMVGAIKTPTQSGKRLVKAPDMDLETRKRLAHYFETDIAALSKLLGKDLSHWLSV